MKIKTFKKLNELVYYYKFIVPPSKRTLCFYRTKLFLSIPEINVYTRIARCNVYTDRWVVNYHLFYKINKKYLFAYLPNVFSNAECCFGSKSLSYNSTEEFQEQEIEDFFKTNFYNLRFSSLNPNCYVYQTINTPSKSSYEDWSENSKNKNWEPNYKYFKTKKLGIPIKEGEILRNFVNMGSCLV